VIDVGKSTGTNPAEKALKVFAYESFILESFEQEYRLFPPVHRCHEETISV
jgi:hypothetical protein